MKLVVVWFMVAPTHHKKVVAEIEVTKKGKKFFARISGLTIETSIIFRTYFK